MIILYNLFGIEFFHKRSNGGSVKLGGGNCYARRSQRIEGFHNEVCTFTRFCNISWFHFVQHGMEKNNKECLNFQFASWKFLKFQPSVCCDILTTRL